MLGPVCERELVYVNVPSDEIKRRTKVNGKSESERRRRKTKARSRLNFERVLRLIILIDPLVGP